MQMYSEFENPHFPLMYIAGICMEESVSQNFELGLSFCFMVFRRRNFEKEYKNSQKLPVFYHKIKTRT